MYVCCALRPHHLLAPPFQAELDDKMPSSLRLEDECRGLSELLLRGGFSSGGSVDPVEMPGQYLAGNEVWTGGRGSGGR